MTPARRQRARFLRAKDGHDGRLSLSRTCASPAPCPHLSWLDRRDGMTCPACDPPR